MPKINFLQTAYSALALLFIANSAGFLLQPALAGTVLKGNVREEGAYAKGDPSLNRGDIAPGGDEFGGSLEPAGFGVDAVRPPAPPKQPLRGNAQGEGGDQFNPMNGTPMADAMPRQQPPPQQMPAPPVFNPNDPDSSPDMQLAWDLWHKRVAGELYRRYSTLANVAFKTSRPLYTVAAYSVSRDGRVMNARLLEPSGNIIYNTLVLGVINSVSGDMSILAFPPGSRRMMVEKSGSFKQNYGQQEGFRYTTGDYETVRQQQMRQQQMHQQQQQQMQQQVSPEQQMQQQIMRQFGGGSR